MKRLAIGLIGACGSVSLAWAALQAGDVAVIAYNTDMIDSFAWVALVDIPSNTPIHFTNSSVSNGWFRWGDHLGRTVTPGPLTWISTNQLAAGSVVSWIAGTQKCWSIGLLSGGGMALNASGDQIIAFTGQVTNNPTGFSPWVGDPSGAVMLYGLNFANSGWDNINGGSVNSSFVPPGLSTSAYTAVHAGNGDNGYYSGIRTGTVTRLRATLASPANWTLHPDFIAPESWPVSFRVLVAPGMLMRVE